MIFCCIVASIHCFMCLSVDVSHIINVGGHIDLTCAAGGLVGGGMNEFVAMHNIRILKFIRVLCIWVCLQPRSPSVCCGWDRVCYSNIGHIDTWCPIIPRGWNARVEVPVGGSGECVMCVLMECWEVPVLIASIRLLHLWYRVCMWWWSGGGGGADGIHLSVAMCVADSRKEVEDVCLRMVKFGAFAY